MARSDKIRSWMSGARLRSIMLSVIQALERPSRRAVSA
jgi:hypothetical protein